VGRYRDEIDLLLTDMVMPGGIDGLELTRRLRADKPDLRVIVATGYSSAIARLSQSAQVGFAVLAKPCELSQLLAAVRTTLGRR
jgi:CheY-like chemotaxis protein